jgi:hypothetical protein
MGNKTEEPWVVLSGCNSCINTSACEKLGNCVMLTIDKAIPEYNKRKRKLITRIRNGAQVNLEELFVEQQEEKNVQQQEEFYMQTVNLTMFEKMAINSLSKKR